MTVRKLLEHLIYTTSGFTASYPTICCCLGTLYITNNAQLWEYGDHDIVEHVLKRLSSQGNMSNVWTNHAIGPIFKYI